MKNFKTLIAILLANKSAQFVGIPSYTSTTSGREYQNMVININLSTDRLKKNWVAKLSAFNLADFDFKGLEKNQETLKEAFDEILESAKNALLPYSQKNNRAKAQIDNYDYIKGTSISYCLGTQSLKIWGVKISGKVLNEGTFKEPARLKTKYKRAIENQLEKRNFQAVPYTLENIKDIRANGKKLEIS